MASSSPSSSKRGEDTTSNAASAAIPLDGDVGGDGLVDPTIHNNTNYENWTDELERISAAMKEGKHHPTSSDQPPPPAKLAGIDINQMVAEELNPTEFILEEHKPVRSTALTNKD